MLNIIFAYGTLMLPEVMEAVTGGRFRSEAATLKDYARYRFKRRVYPGLAREEDGCVTGVVYPGLDGRSIQLLDQFEGPCYKRLAVMVESKNRTIKCETYVVVDKYRALLGKAPWDIGHFSKVHLKDYLKGCGS